MGNEQRNLTQTIITSPDTFCEIGPEWDRLVVETDQKNPFTFWGWSQHWWKLWGQPQGDSLHIFTYRDSNRTLRAILPMIQANYGLEKISPRLPKVTLWKALRPVGRIPPGIDPQGGVVMETKPLIVSPGWEEPVAAAFLGSIRQNRTHSWIDMSGFLNLSFMEALQTDHFQQTFEVDNSYFVLPMPHTPEELYARFSENMQKNLRRRKNKRKRDGRELDTVILQETNQITEAMRDFFRLHTARAKMEGAPKHMDYYPTRQHRDYLRGVSQSLPSGVFRIALGRINGNIEAIRVFFVINDCAYLYDSGFNPEFSTYGIMQSLNIDIVRQLMQDPRVTQVNLSVGMDENKLRWQPEERFIYKLRMIPPNRKAELLFRLATLAGYLRKSPV